MALSNGVMKPCTTAIGGDQYKLPEQLPQMAQFYSTFYFILKMSSVIGGFLTPVLRSDFTWLSQPDRYSFIFALMTGITILSISLFLGGSRYYVKKPPAGNRLLQICQCMMTAVRHRSSEISAGRITVDWLDRARDKHDEQLIQEARIFINIFVVVLPMPMVFALNEQVGSSWVLQAGRMDGRLGSWYTIKADQLQVLVQLFVLVLIPMCDWWLYPQLAKIRVRTPLQKLLVGSVLSLVAFLLAGGVEAMNEQRLGSDRNDGAVHMVWLLPQYFMIALAEAIVGVTGLVFMNMEAPASLKTVMSAVWFVCHSMGNLINVMILSIGFTNQVSNIRDLFQANKCICLVVSRLACSCGSPA